MTVTTDTAGLTRAIADRLALAGVASPEWDARQLIAHARGSGLPVEDLVRRREQREPLQHILGTAAFRYLDLAVGPGVFIPRPETELVVEAALSATRGLTDPVVVDLCAGSGAIGLSIAHELRAVGVPGQVHLVESDPAAMPWLRRNAAPFDDLSVCPFEPWEGPPARTDKSQAPHIEVHEADLADAPTGLDGRVDVVVSNPPYLPASARPLLDVETAEYDPALALWGGPDGLDVIRRIVPVAARLLRPGGTLVIEHDVTHDLADLLAGGWTEIQRHCDLTGRPRFTVAVRA